MLNPYYLLRIIMAQLDDLMAAVAAIQADVSALDQDVLNVKALVEALQGQAAPDLGPTIAALGDIHTKLAGVDAGLDAIAPDPQA
jgi:hypothetical protein